ncbi:hypothetical protein GWK47_046533 [Chionoecetes opilio]|uniref:Uncharacterized protein n=1 Tax=Chionoecetes opilio TaxID=41210 RepID=A0A8J4YCX4_CHIOP|nr:hypothetical protein GWK47_046533 [Chionoecetes opilio]
MAKRKFGAILLLSVIVPLLVSTIILIIVVMVLPNSEPRTESVSQDGQSTGNKTKQQLSPLSYKTKSRVLFILGVTFACSLFVFLIVIIAVACAWARKAKGCVVGDQNSEVTSQVYNNVDCQLTKHTERVSEGNQTKYSINTRKDRVNSITTAAPPCPLVKTVAVPTQVSSRNSGERDVDDNLQNFYIHGRETCPIVQPTSYGTLGRTHLLSTVDEDGYHVDNLGFDSEEANTEEFLSSLGKRQSSAPGCQQSFPTDISESVGTIQPSTAERQNTTVASAEVEYSDQDNKSQKHLSKQDSFQGLPPLRPFDRYLTLVRLDSDTSLESYSLEATRNIWKSIDEEDEKEENMMVQKEEAFNK